MEILGSLLKNKYFGRNKKRNENYVNYSVVNLGNIFSKTVITFPTFVNPTLTKIFHSYTLIKSMDF